MTTKSPSAAGRSTSDNVANRSRSACSCSSTSASEIVTSSTVASRPSYDGSVISGFTSTSAGNSSPSSPCLVTSISGWASGSGGVVWGGSLLLLRQPLVDRLVEHRLAADLAVDDRRRHLAAAEAGHVDLL